MELAMRYNVVAMLSHWKLEKMKIYQKRKSQQTEVLIVCYENGLQDTKVWTQFLYWWNTYKYSSTSIFPDILSKEIRHSPSVLKKYYKGQFL